MVQVIWSIQARNDLDAIVEHIALDSPARAEVFHWEALESSLSLERHPKKGHPVPEMSDPSIREIRFGNYRIIYWLKSEAEVVVLTMRHGKRQLPRALVVRRRSSNR